MKKMQELLLRSFDQVLSASEQQNLDKALKQSEWLRQEKVRIENMRAMFSEGGQESFRPMFAERVMNRLAEGELVKSSYESDFFNSLLFIFRRVVIVGVIAIVVLASVQLFTPNSGNTTVQPQNISDMSLDEVLYSAFSPSMEEIL